MRKAAAVVAMAAITVGLVGWAGGASASKVHKEVRYVRLVVGQGFYVDNDPSGQSGGDLFGSTGDLTHDGANVGTFSSACTAASAERAQCDATFVWNSGDRLQLAGDLRMQEVQNHLSIVGGTRKYKKARGDATLTRLDDQGQTQRVRLRILR
jgi:hypothetical protein